MRFVNILKSVNKSKKWDTKLTEDGGNGNFDPETILCDLCVRKWNKCLRGQRIYFNQTDEEWEDYCRKEEGHLLDVRLRSKKWVFFFSIFSLRAVISCELRIPPRTDFSLTFKLNPGESKTSLSAAAKQSCSVKTPRPGHSKSCQEKHLDIQGFFGKFLWIPTSCSFNPYIYWSGTRLTGWRVSWAWRSGLWLVVDLFQLSPAAMCLNPVSAGKCFNTFCSLCKRL